jgi:hypothetical protein
MRRRYTTGEIKFRTSPLPLPRGSFPCGGTTIQKLRNINTASLLHLRSVCCKTAAAGHCANTRLMGSIATWPRLLLILLLLLLVPLLLLLLRCRCCIHPARAHLCYTFPYLWFECPYRPLLCRLAHSPHGRFWLPFGCQCCLLCCRCCCGCCPFTAAFRCRLWQRCQCGGGGRRAACSAGGGLHDRDVHW